MHPSSGRLLVFCSPGIFKPHPRERIAVPVEQDGGDLIVGHPKPDERLSDFKRSTRLFPTIAVNLKIFPRLIANIKKVKIYVHVLEAVSYTHLRAHETGR